MAFINNLPLQLRLALLFVVGAFLAGQINRAIYRLAWHARDIGPWSKPDPRATGRRRLDYVPIIGWIGLRREASIHGAAFWLRPMLIEICFAFAVAWLYYWNVEQAGLIPGFPGKAAVMLHCLWLSQVCLITLLTIATFIDFDEQSIPDEITVPGTILALVFAAVLPCTRLPVVVGEDPGAALQVIPLAEGSVEKLLLIAPWRLEQWPHWLDEASGLWTGIACFVAWCLAITPWLWDTRHGVRKAFQYLVAHMIRPRRKTKRPDGSHPRRPFPLVLIVLALIVVGPLGIAAAWGFGGLYWCSLLSALVGLAFGGGLIWAVRIIGTRALGREAMGFGDVTLMAMIGAFMGWQPSLIIFFLAPLAAVVIAILQVLLSGRHDIAFGPYLALGTVVCLLGWARIWNHWAAELFLMGWWIPEMMVVCLVLMAIMLLAWRLIKERIFS